MFTAMLFAAGASGYSIDFRTVENLPSNIAPGGECTARNIKLARIEGEQLLLLDPAGISNPFRFQFDVSGLVYDPAESPYLSFHYRLAKPKPAGGIVNCRIELTINGVATEWNRAKKSGVINARLAADKPGWSFARIDLKPLLEHWRRQTGSEDPMKIETVRFAPGAVGKRNEQLNGRFYLRSLALGTHRELLGVGNSRFVRGEKIGLRSAVDGTLFFTGWSRPALDAAEIAALAKTEHGMSMQVKRGRKATINTAAFHPGGYNLSIIENGVVEAVKEVVITYPADHVFDLADPLLHGIMNIWNIIPSSREYDKHYAVVATSGQLSWDEVQPEETVFDFSRVDRLLEFAAYTQKPLMFKLNHPAPEWIFDHVAHVGGKSPVTANGRGGGRSRNGAKAPQFWAPAYKKFYREMIEALAAHVAESPNRKWFLGRRVQPNAFNEEAWHYKFNGKEMQIAGISPDRGTWIPPRNGSGFHPSLMEAGDYKEAKAYFREVIGFYQEAFHPLGIYTFLRPYLEVDHGLNLDLAPYYANKYTVCMGTDATASRTKPLSNRALVFRKYAREMKKGAYHEDTWASMKAIEWNASHGREPNYKLIPPTPEQSIYWRQFLKLHEGVTLSAFGTVELLELHKPAYQAAIDLFSNYAGGELDPAKADAAWLVMAGFTDWKLDVKMRNVGYWLEESDPSQTRIIANADPTDHRGFMLGTIVGHETSFSVAPEFLNTHRDRRAKVSVEWLAAPGDSWELVRDGVVRSDTSGYRTDVFDLPLLAEQIVLRKLGGDPRFHIIEVRIDQK